MLDVVATAQISYSEKTKHNRTILTQCNTLDEMKKVCLYRPEPAERKGPHPPTTLKLSWKLIDNIVTSSCESRERY